MKKEHLSINADDMKSLLPVCQRGDTVDVNIEQPGIRGKLCGSKLLFFQSLTKSFFGIFFRHSESFMVFQSLSKHFSECFRVSSTAFQRNLEKHWQQLPQANLTNEFV